RHPGPHDRHLRTLSPHAVELERHGQRRARAGGRRTGDRAPGAGSCGSSAGGSEGKAGAEGKTRRQDRTQTRRRDDEIHRIEEELAKETQLTEPAVSVERLEKTL